MPESDVGWGKGMEKQAGQYNQPKSSAFVQRICLSLQSTPERQSP